ncbi:hypothetical protein [Alteriqipengyuania sp.]|uniref:hypothetical protein n=1 Tax=Alteriqipengyuania sp. TaxID=2800692 RepID=UPI003511FB52
MPNAKLADSMIHADRAIRTTQNIIKGSRCYDMLGPARQAFIDDQLFRRPQIDLGTPSSALMARRDAGAALAATTQLYFHDLLGQAPEPYLATFAFSDGEVPMGHRLRNVQTSINRAKDALLQVGLEGLLSADIDLLLPIGAKTPITAFHLHGIVFHPSAGNRKFRLKHAATKMEGMIGVPSRLPYGVKLGGKRPGDFRSHADRMATYAGKWTAALKIETRTADEGPRFGRSRPLYTPAQAVNFLYSWSQIPVLNSVIPVGSEGAAMYRAWRRKIMRRNHIERVELSMGDLRSNWADVMKIVNGGESVVPSNV